jgi:hypothetical protein
MIASKCSQSQHLSHLAHFTDSSPLMTFEVLTAEKMMMFWVDISCGLTEPQTQTTTSIHPLVTDSEFVQ